MALLFRALGTLLALTFGVIVLVAGGSSAASFFALAYVAWFVFGSRESEPSPTVTLIKPSNNADVQNLYRRVQIGATVSQVADVAGSSGDVVAGKRVDADELHVRRWHDDLGWTLYVAFKNNIVQSSTIAPSHANAEVTFTSSN